jgi:hypothetical protein
VPGALLETLAAGHIPERTTLKIPANDNIKVEWLRGFLEHYNVTVLGDRQNGQRYFFDVACPWAEQHHSDSCPTASSVGYERGWGYSYKCFHSECTKEERGWQEFKQRGIEQNPDLPPYGNVLPALPSECSHADIARYFIEHETAAKNHIQLYDLGSSPIRSFTALRNLVCTKTCPSRN